MDQIVELYMADNRNRRWIINELNHNVTSTYVKSGIGLVFFTNYHLLFSQIQKYSAYRNLGMSY